MKKIFKYSLSLLLTMSLTGCSFINDFVEDDDNYYQARSYADKPNEEFTKYLDELVVDIASSDYTTMHQFFEHPEDYGIDVDKVEVTLGSIEEEPIEEDELIDKLYDFDYESLDKVQQDIYDELDFEIQLSEKLENEDYKYLGNLWGGANGTHQSLITFFSEYLLREEQDIDGLVALLNDVPRYIDEALDHTKKQAELDLLYMDYDTVLGDIKNVLDTKDNSAILQELYDEVDGLKLDSTKTQMYKEQIKDAFNSSFIPAFEKIDTVLNSLKKKNHSLTGLANLKGGKPYYELLVQSATGSTKDIETIRGELEDAADKALTSLQKLIRKNYGAVDNMYSIDTGFNSVDEILAYLLLHYEKDYGKIGSINYELNPLSNEQSKDGIVAYFVTPAIDNTTDYQIRYNKRDYGDDPSSIELYTTLAHEGIPGHMYQAQYYSEHLGYNIQYLLDCLGFSEGYATYVEFQSLNYLNEDKDTLNAYKLNEILTDMYVALMDISIHYDGLSLEEFTDEYSDLFGYDLEGIYNQLCENPSTFLSYYYGYLEITQLRNEAKEKLGKDFNNKDFNTALLSSGYVNFDVVTRNIYEYIYE